MAARNAVKCVPEITRNHCPTSAKCAHMHPEAAEKIGPGIESFSVRTADYGTRCFWVNRVDGTTEKFSFRACY